MKERLKKFRTSSVFMVIIMLLCAVFGVCDGSAMTADVISPEGGGAVQVDAANSLTDTRDSSVRLILDTIDEKVTKIRPHDVVLDTISRHINDKKNSNAQKIRHYAIDVIDLTADLKTAVTAGVKQTNLITSNNDIFASEQTIICCGVKGYKEDHTTVNPDEELMLYVVGKNNNNEPLVVAVNGTGADGMTLPDIPDGTKLLRAGRAGSETQIQTDPYSGVPTDWEQYLQKFMAQIELTELFQRADKEVDWEFNDAEEEAVYDMKRVQNVTYWKGVKARIKSKNAHTSKAEEIFFTRGIWTQAGKDFSFGNSVDSGSMVNFMKNSFVGNASGKQKIFLVGSDLLEKIEQVEYTKIIKVGETSAAHGLIFNKMISKFGTLLIAHDQSLDDIGKSDCGFVLDADFLRKWTMGWRVTNFDFRKSGQSDSDGRGLMEICGLVLKNPKAHTRVTLN